MRQTIIASWCDACMRQEKRTDGRTVNLHIDGESKSLELCPKHEQQLLAPLQVLLEVYGVELKGRAAAAIEKQVQPLPPTTEAYIDLAPPLFPTPVSSSPSNLRLYECPSCGKKYDKRNSFIYHLREAEGVAQATDTSCPDCGREFDKVSTCTTHRVRDHGYDGVQAMLAKLEDMMSGSKRKAG